MIFYMFFSVIELWLRFWITILLYFLYLLRLTIFISLPIIVFITCVLIVAKISFRLYKVTSDENRTPSQIISVRGFQPEVHEVTTSDGYILVLHRIINPFVKESVRLSKPILLMHGLGTNSMNWLMNDENGSEFKKLIDPRFHQDLSQEEKILVKHKCQDALAFELAKRGYDVWLGNQRGNYFSNKHETLNPEKDVKYWDFSMDEIAKYDLPATIEYILSQTNQDKLAYVGLSQGATSMFALLASEPKYNQMIKPFIAMAPVIRSKHSYFVNLFPDFFKRWASWLATYIPGKLHPGFYEFILQTFFCNHSFESISNVFGRMMYSGKHINTKRVSVFFSFPGVHCSRKNASYYMQLAYNEFCQFDYGTVRSNRLKYGSDRPPLYNLDKVTNPFIGLVFSRDDTMASYRDILYLKHKLTNTRVFDEYFVTVKGWDHEDFLLGKNCGQIIHSRIVKVLHKALTPDLSSFNETNNNSPEGSMSPVISSSSSSTDGKFEFVDRDEEE